jgi:uncharacterized damage-inducible protein DinB
MIRTDYLKLFAYSDNCWRLLGETLATAPDAWDVSFETTSQWNSIRLLLAHCVAAEERLVTLRLRNRPLPIPYEQFAADGWDGLYSDQQAIRAETYAYLASLSDSEIEGAEIVVPATVERGAWTRSDVLFHVLNHENYHRGQVIMVLQRLGYDPPNFDYVLLRPSM